MSEEASMELRSSFQETEGQRRPDGTESARRCLCERVGGDSDSAETLGRDSLLDETARQTPAHLHCPAAAACSELLLPCLLYIQLV